MIPNIQTRELLTNNQGETRTFTIEANAIAYRALTSNLYSNPVAACIRELSTNARDAHVEAGIPDEPFSIHLPTPLNPTFTVRDYGISMTHDLVMDLYSTLFGSTKRNTNDLTGGFGLGRMAALNVADGFFITCFLDGIERSYSVYLDAQGIPSLSKMSEQPTTERQGFQVTIPIKDEDITKFTKEAEYNLLGFNPRPTINMEWTVGDPLIKGEGWAFYLDLDPQCYVSMGNVLYPVKPGYGEYELRTKTDSHRGFIFEAPIGALSVSTSRDSINYDDKTVTFLDNMFNQKAPEIFSVMEQRYQLEPSYIDACKLYRKVRNQYDANGRGFYYGDRMLRVHPYSESDLGYRFVFKNYAQHLSWRKSVRSANLNLETLGGKIVLFEPEGLKQATARVRRYLKENPPPYNSDVYWAREKIEGVNYIDLSDYEPLITPKAPRATSQRKPGMRMEFFQHGGIQKEVLVPDDNMIFVKGDDSLNYKFKRNVRKLIQAGLVNNDQVFVQLTDKLEAGLSKSSFDFKSRMFDDVIRKLINKKYPRSLPPLRAINQYAESRLIEACEGYKLGKELRNIKKWIDAQAEHLDSDILTLLQHIVPDKPVRQSKVPTTSGYDEFLKSCPLLDYLPDNQFAYYLKLEGKLK